MCVTVSSLGAAALHLHPSAADDAWLAALFSLACLNCSLMHSSSRRCPPIVARPSSLFAAGGRQAHPCALMACVLACRTTILAVVFWRSCCCSGGGVV